MSATYAKDNERFTAIPGSRSGAVANVSIGTVVLLPPAQLADDLNASWPDAPVTYIATAAMSDPAVADAPNILRQAALRGWTIESTNNPATILGKLATD